MKKIKVWDGPTRLFHWSLVLSICVSYVSAEFGAGSTVTQLGIFGYVTDMDVHAFAGYTALSLLIFRIIYGFLGSTTARFSHFVKHPGTVLKYLSSLRSKHADETIGHNPAGGMMVLVLLLILLVQAVLGLFTTNEDDMFDAPLSGMVGQGWANTLTGYHELLFNFIMVVVGLHVLAILFYWIVKKTNLILPMILGWKIGPENQRLPELHFASPIIGLVLFACSALSVWAIIGLR